MYAEVIIKVNDLMFRLIINALINTTIGPNKKSNNIIKKLINAVLNITNW